MSAITDDEIAQHPIPGPHGSRRWCCDECSWKYEERLRERVRADAATIADLRRQVEALREAAPEEILSAIARRNATIARLRAVARAAQRWCHTAGGSEAEAKALADMRDTFDALAPGDLGGEG